MHFPSFFGKLSQMSVQIKKLHEDVTEKLLSRIQSGEFKPGDRLPAERTLAAEYGVSRSVIREVMSSLNQMGCIVSKVGGGSFVKTPDTSDIVDPLSIMVSQDDEFAIEMIEARLVIEPAVARLAALRRTSEQLPEMWATIEKMRSEAVKGSFSTTLDSRFHELLTEAANNRALAMTVLGYSRVLNRSMELTQSLEGVPHKTIAAHENILRAVERQDAQAAENAMRQHLVDAHENLKRVLNKK